MVMNSILALGLLASASLHQVDCAPPPSGAPTAETRNGSYYGVNYPSLGQDIFHGIPYAQPPVGQLRFARPQGLNTTWSDVRNATQNGPTCVAYGADVAIKGKNYTSEDCLSLYVARPAGAPSEPLPVAVWIHGGGFTYGSGTDGWYNMSSLVERSVELGQPILGVGLNYRLAAWGFAFSDAFVEEGATNLGLRDQRLALEWIQENIAAFGGDPSKVTIFGESAGSISVVHQMLAYNGRDDGLFSGAIGQSGVPLNVGPWLSSNDKLEIATENITLTVCPDAVDKLACLRDADFEELNNAIDASLTLPVSGLLYGPVVDGDIYARSALEQLKEGAIVQVPCILGTNNDEGSYFLPGTNTEVELRDTIITGLALNTTQTDTVLAAYPYDDPEAGIAGVPASHFNTTVGLLFKRGSTIATDVVMKAPTRNVAQLWEASGASSPIYVYNANTTITLAGNWYGSAHGFELPFTFYNLNGTGWEVVEGGEAPFNGGNPLTGRPQPYLDLAAVISGMWVGFFKNRVPSYANQPAPEWPRFGADELVINFDAQPEYLNVYVSPEQRAGQKDILISMMSDK